jgi:uncharacterized protein
MILRLLIRMNNRITALRRVRVPGANILLLLPHCLHRDSCKQNVERDLAECQRCGKCGISDMIRIRDEFGVLTHVVGGGQQALLKTKETNIKAIVAVACEKELVHGIFYTFPKPVVAVMNETPEGPCRNTVVDVDKVSAAIRSIIVGDD